ncbi:energy-coupling factor transporter transmembrane component T family protein [Actinomyces trachealis]|uniref:energy-coupling factor transporter transmembrane component T family protein n=1 Tax=Actinomyces trachealis TaxID=2763540 RepID=UPI001892B4C8|nr:energy-coupling factor transporter transmembrane component T [Actinomyces trachealis]
MTHPTAGSTGTPTRPRPYPGPGLASWLDLDPLSPFTAATPVVMVVALQTTHVPALWALVVGLVLLVVADLRRGLLAAGAVLLVSTLIAATLALSAPVERVGLSPVVLEVWGLHLQRNQLLAGLRLGGKLGAAMSLFILTGLLARPQALLQALVSHLRVPYRVAYAGVAALGFRERFSHEYQVIQEAHRLRGTRAPLRLLRPVVRRWTALPALMAGAVRHAERVSMSMDARGFGAYRTRTERSVPRWRMRDTLVVALGWTAAAYIAWSFLGTGLVVHDI